MKLKQSILQKVSEAPVCRRNIMEALDVSPPTMTRYIRENDDNLTKAASLKAIGEYFNLTNEQMLEEDQLTTIDSVS